MNKASSCTCALNLFFILFIYLVSLVCLFVSKEKKKKRKICYRDFVGKNRDFLPVKLRLKFEALTPPECRFRSQPVLFFLFFSIFFFFFAPVYCKRTYSAISSVSQTGPQVGTMPRTQVMRN